MFVLKLLILLIVVTTITVLVVSPIWETLEVSSRSDKRLCLTGTPVTLQGPIKFPLRVTFRLERSIPKTFLLMSTKSKDGTKVKFMVRKRTMYLQVKPATMMNNLGLIALDRLNYFTVHCSDRNLVVVLNKKKHMLPRLENTFEGLQVTFGKSKQTYASPMCTLVSFHVQDRMLDLRSVK